LDVRSISCPAGYGRPPAVAFDSFGYASLHCVPQERKGIQEITLPSRVSAYQNGQRVKGHIAVSDTLIAPNANPAKKCRFRLLVDLVNGHFAIHGCHGLSLDFWTAWLIRPSLFATDGLNQRDRHDGYCTWASLCSI